MEWKRKEQVYQWYISVIFWLFLPLPILFCQVLLPKKPIVCIEEEDFSDFGDDYTLYDSCSTTFIKSRKTFYSVISNNSPISIHQHLFSNSSSRRSLQRESGISRKVSDLHTGQHVFIISHVIRLACTWASSVVLQRWDIMSKI